MTNPSHDPWIARATEQIAAQAEPWMKMSDEELWGLMFGPTIPRSWHVWSDGHCPTCKAPVPMYEWRADAMARRWKLTCPKCAAAFPTNDFEAYHRSGLSAAGWFEPSKADRALLFNADHPDPADPLHDFGVDDGHGFVQGERRWRFIGAYLIYGHWRQLILGGVRRLVDAYLVTKNAVCAQKALILMDRIADIFPEFNFAEQAWMYEKPGHTVHSDGHVTYWCENCEDVRVLAEAWRSIRARVDDAPLVTFLAAKASALGGTGKRSGSDIRANIENRIIREALAHPLRMRSNFPRSEIAKVALLDAVDTPESKAEAEAITESLIRATTSVDGLTGEKGLATYSSYVIASLASFLAKQERGRPGFIRRWVELEPNLRKTWRFFLDTRCIGEYYPAIGDALWFGARIGKLGGVNLPSEKKLDDAAGVGPSAFCFLWWLYETTGDVDYVRALYEGNGSRLDDLPRDIATEDPSAFRAKVAELITRYGAPIRLPSVDKKEWHLAILRSGEGAHARALWLDYDSGGNHGHMDGMNVGLFAHGLDLIPDFGYPPVQYGGWRSPKSRWYYQTAAHHTVVIDGASQPEVTTWKEIDSQSKRAECKDGSAKPAQPILPKPPAGTTTIWQNQSPFQIVQIDGRNIYGRPDVKQYERTLMLIDVDETRFYVVDIFRVVGGGDHAKFVHGYFGTLETTGIAPVPAPQFGHNTLMRDFLTDPNARPGWAATFRVHDKYGFLPDGRKVNMRYHDLTSGAAASTCEGWINGGHYAEIAEAWIPRLMIRKQAGDGELSSCFVSVLEVFESNPVIEALRRLPLKNVSGTDLPDSCVGLEIGLANGVVDRVFLADVLNPRGDCPWPSNATTIAMIDSERGKTITQAASWNRA